MRIQYIEGMLKHHEIVSGIPDKGIPGTHYCFLGGLAGVPGWGAKPVNFSTVT